MKQMTFLTPLGLILGERSAWDVNSIILLLLNKLVPGTLACMRWDNATRRGKFVLVAAFAYLIPLLSTIMTGLMYGLKLDSGVWFACLLGVAGAVICKLSVIESPRPRPLPILRRIMKI